MWQQREELAKLNVDTKVVTFDADFMAQAYIENTKITWPLLLDPQQTLYGAYGMEHCSWWAIYRLSSIWNYLKLMFRGRTPGKPGKDWRQLGGDVLIDPTGFVRLHYVSTGPHDRPSWESIQSTIQG